MKHGVVLLGLSLQTLAYPFALNDATSKVSVPDAVTDAAKQLSKSRTNCGVFPCLTFDADEQWVSTRGEHAFVAPSRGQIRGPCPGLNAAANHGYLPRSGIASITETVTGLSAAFGMGAGLSSFLAVYAILMTGDPILGTWSIGGPQPTNFLTKGLLGKPQGISWSHNLYETDMSIGRPDAYMNNGDAHSLDIKRFAASYATGLENDRYTMDGFAQDFANKGRQSVETNPFFFSAPFSGVIVAPAAYFFVANLMSNHSAEEPSGYLNGEMFKQFFAVSGDYPRFKWHPGQERIPDRWYRRPSTSPYDIPNADADLGVQYTAYPESFYLGGNTNGVNSFVGVSLEDLTGGLLNAGSLFDVANPKAACFYAQFAQALIPDSANTLLGTLASAVTGLVGDFIKPVVAGLDCPIVNRFDQSLFNKYPGKSYNPKGSATSF